MERALLTSELMEHRETRAVALEMRTRRFAVDVIMVCQRLAGASVIGDMARQLGRAANSVAVNHRAVRRSRSLKEFASKLQVVNEEVDEAVHWLEVLMECELAPNVELKALIQEGRELRAIFATARKTTRKRLSMTPVR